MSGPRLVPCRGNTRRLIALLGGALRAGAADRLRQHLTGCPGCREAYARLERTAGLCRELGQEEPPSLSWLQIEAQVRWKLAQQPARRTSLRWIWAGAALGGALAVGAALGVIFFGQTRTPAPVPDATTTATAPAPLPAPDEELAAIVTLSQGGVQVISSRGLGRPLDFARPLLQGERLVTAEGRAAIQWAERTGILALDRTEVGLGRLRSRAQELTLHRGKILAQVNPLRPEASFTVAARGHRVTVRGTFFSVELTADALEVAVYQGTVELAPLDGSWTPRRIKAGHSSRLSLGAAGRPGLAQLEGSPVPSLLNLQPWPGFLRVMAETGLLAVESLPVGLDLHLDSQLLGPTNLTLRSGLGRHLVELYRDGKLLRQQWVEVRPGGGRLSLDLRPRLTHRPPPRLPEGFGEVIRSRAVQIQGCYERRLKHDPTLAGKLVLRLKVDEEGRVAQASLEHDTLADPRVGQCALSVVQRWSFPAHSPAELVYPFHFRPH